VLLLGSLCASVAEAAFPAWTLEIDNLSVGPVSIEQITASSATTESGESGVELRASRVVADDEAIQLGPVSLRCPGQVIAVAESLCELGTWKVVIWDDWPVLDGTLLKVSMGDDELAAQARGNFGTVVWNASLKNSAASYEISVLVPGQPIMALQHFESRLPSLNWISVGMFEGWAEISGVPGESPTASAKIRIAGVDFDSPDGLYAGLGVGAHVSARTASEAVESITVEGQLSSGELLMQDFYRDFSGETLNLTAQIHLRDGILDVERASLDDSDSLHLAGEARVPIGTESGEAELILRELRLQFPEAYTRYIEPIAAVHSLDGLETNGAISWAGDWSPGTARSGELRLENLGVRDAMSGRFAVEGLQGTLRTGSESRLSWDTASFAKLGLGAGEARIALSEDSISLQDPLRIPVFGGGLLLERLSVGFPPEGETDIQLEAAVENIDMQQMSRALGWPEFAGTLSGHIPGMTFASGVLDIGGALDFQIFGGQVLLSDLRVERPFGVLPSLAANINATALDLAELTQTFEFGRIAGRIDGYVHELRMLDWQPVQFDAWFGTPKDSGKNDISRQAVRHLTSIGGGSPTAILSGPVLRLFNNFSYRRLGLGCYLQDNICRIRGLEEQGESVLLLEGAGIPKISIVAYNRSIDFRQLVAQLGAVSSGEEVKIGN